MDVGTDIKRSLNFAWKKLLFLICCFRFQAWMLIFRRSKCVNGDLFKWFKSQTEIYGLFCEFIAPRLLPNPREEKFGCYFESGTCLGGLETHVLLSYLWSFFCMWLVINVTLVTKKMKYMKYKTSIVLSSHINDNYLSFICVNSK